MQYLQNIWSARYFWFYLVQSDLRARWRRSFFGIFWSMLQPLGLTCLISFVFSRLFNTDIVSYAPYILSGIIIWEFISTCCIGGALAFVQSDAYIRQCRQPLAIYTLRSCLVALILLLMATVPLLGWTLVTLPQNFNLSWLALLTFYPLAVLVMWPIATILAYLTARLRDIPHALGLILQACWFVSPVYFEEKMFRNGGMDILVDYNPVYHLMRIIRAPLLHGEWPSMSNYLVIFGLIGFLMLLAVLVGLRAERRVIFYL